MTNDEAVELGKLRAAQARAILTDEQRARVDALVAQVPLLAASLCYDDSKPTVKGRAHKVVILPEGVEDMRVVPRAGGPGLHYLS